MTGQYGEFAYGGRQPRTPPRVDRRPFDRGVGPEFDEADIFGAGFALNSAAHPGTDFDIRPDPETGGIQRASGLDFFAGELSLKLATVADALLGSLASPEDIADFRTQVMGVLDRDNRVVSVEYLSVFGARDGTGAVVVDIEFTTPDDNRHTVQVPVPTNAPPESADALSALP